MSGGGQVTGGALETDRSERPLRWAHGAAPHAGLAVAVASADEGKHHIEVGSEAVVASVGIPVAVVLVMLWVLRAPLNRNVMRPESIGIAAALVLLTAYLAPTVGVAAGLTVIAVILVLLLVATLARGALRAPTPSVSGIRR